MKSGSPRRRTSASPKAEELSKQYHKAEIEKLKEAMRKDGAKRIREACMVFVKELKESVNLGGDQLTAKTKAKPSERFNTWQPNHYSTVTITMEDKDGATNLEIVQVGVPEEEVERTEKGWKGLLLDRLKAMLGGTVLG